MNIYQNNAFRVLGLLTGASARDIAHRAEEIKAKKSVDVHDVYEYDFPWLGPLDRSEENISSAVQRLEDPVRRIKQELSWFWSLSASDKDAIAWLSRNRPKSAVDIWLKAAGISLAQLEDKNFDLPASEESLSALHNLFVLLQAVLLRNEVMSAKGEDPILLLDNTEGAEKDWAIALKIFNFLHENTKFWQLVQKRMADLKDKRLANVSMDEIKESALNNALSAHFFLITRALEKRDLAQLDKHIEILEKADMPQELYQSGLNQVLHSRIANMNSLNEQFNRERKALDAAGDSALLKSLFYKYRDSSKPLIDDFKAIDPKGMTDFVLSQEKFAKSFHQLSWKLNKTGDPLGALEILGEAYQNLKSDALRMECQNDAASMMKDAVQQYGQDLTKKISSGGEIPIEDLMGIKVQYLDQVNSLLSVGQTFLTKDLQAAIHDLVAAELKVISLEVKNKYQAQELAQNVIREAIDWATDAKKEDLRKSLEAIERNVETFEPETVGAPAGQPSRGVIWGVVIVGLFAAVAWGVRGFWEPATPGTVPPAQTVSAGQASLPPELPPRTATGDTADNSPKPGVPPAVAVESALGVAAMIAPVAVTTGAVAAVVSDTPADAALTDRAALLEEATLMRERIEAHKEKIRAMETELELKSRESEFRQASISRLNNKIGSNPDSPEYNFWVGEHNELVREQNEAVENAKMLYEQYQSEFKSHQDMIKTYNERFAR